MTDRSLQDAVDDLPDGVVIADADARVTVISSVAAGMLGWPSPAAAAGLPLEEVLRLQGQDGQAWVRCNSPYVGLRTRTAVPEQSWLLPDGTEVLVTARLHRTRPLGEVERLAISIRSGRGRARLDRERSDLVATVAHELRSPLTGVKGFVQALLNRWDKLNDDQKKLMLTTVSADADRLSRLIAELLDVARIDTGRLQMYRRPADADAARRPHRRVGRRRHQAPDRAARDRRPRPGLRRPRQVHPGGHQPRRERRAPRRGDRARARCAPTSHDGRPRRGRWSRSPTRARGSRWSCAAGSSRSSGPAGAAAPGSGSTSCTAWSAPTAATVTIDDAPSGGAVLACTWPGVPDDLGS